MSVDPIADLQASVEKITNVAAAAVQKYTDLVAQNKATDVVVHDAYVPVINAAYVLDANATALQAVVDDPSLAGNLRLLSSTESVPVAVPPIKVAPQ